ncbi:ADP-ribosylhydrolase ARH3-like [Oppia nitens]|uniref:ADP-ribosylhydrolase ARH3-like n=1 Tax=Oppia nitens TaxID=1686743 RepID=UPI0023DC5515|nr:ADP-ribosylhydrolase ARH3-like [Oppia nitens]
MLNQRMSASVTNLLSRFRGCLVGGLIGDCLGSPFEGDDPISRSVLQNFMDKQLKESSKLFQVFSYTDDTAMTKSMVESFVQMKSFDAKDMSKKFTMEYIKEPKRGYGGNVVDVFSALNSINYEHPYEPARHQFNGTGSYGNGGAMRTSPAALFGYNLSDKELISLAANCARITHSHRNGFNGAILQCLAIRLALDTETSQTDQSFDINLYLNRLIEKMNEIEVNGCESDSESDGLNTNGLSRTPYTDKLKKIKELFSDESKIKGLSSERVAYLFGNDVSALNSVPSAIYCALRAQKPIDDIESDNPFVRTLYFALSLGGDTDTIASMACSIAGALYGHQLIPNVLQKRCEDIDLIVKYADNLYSFVSNVD